MTNTKEYEYCLRCGRRLKSQENRERGMGKVCFEKSKKQNKKILLFSVDKS